jgi:transcriptional repressor of cell division inhibition gene dicB
MKKTDAINQLGGTVSAAAKACGVTSSAVSQWPEVLTKDHIDRVQAALWRKQAAKRRNRTPQPA